MRRKYYVAYGSNLNMAQMIHRCPGATAVGSGYLEDWELFYAGSKTGNYATIRPKPGSIVPVGVWLINEDNEQALDRYEGFPTFYYKEDVRVHMLTRVRNLTGMVYIMAEDATPGPPAPYYVKVCRAGYADFGMNQEYLDESLRAAGIKNPGADMWHIW